MNLSTVITNLKNTIAGKEKMLNDQWNKMAFGDPSWQGDIGKQMAIKATIEFLKLNIDELKRILDDLVECEVKGIEHSWRESPDRMGGQFSQDEINNTERWI